LLAVSDFEFDFLLLSTMKGDPDLEFFLEMASNPD
jgi:hypothetical protein